MDIEKKVLLLAILKKKDNENINDILISLEEAKVFTLKKGKQYLKELKNDNLLLNNILTFNGLTKAKEIDHEFKI